MNFKRSPFAIQDKNAKDLDNVKDYPTIADLMREQKVSFKKKCSTENSFTGAT